MYIRFTMKGYSNIVFMNEFKKKMPKNIPILILTMQSCEKVKY